MNPAFTPEQEVRIREIAAEEIEKARSRTAFSIGTDQEVYDLCIAPVLARREADDGN